jgi:hypothetical protein
VRGYQSPYTMQMDPGAQLTRFPDRRKVSSLQPLAGVVRAAIDITLHVVNEAHVISNDIYTMGKRFRIVLLSVAGYSGRWERCGAAG